MMKKEVKKEYTNGELTIVWQPAKCIHAGVCVRTLPNVYDPNKKPWIDVTKASSEALREQVSRCPSGALSYYFNADLQNKTDGSSTKIEIMENGPILVHGSIEVADKNGSRTLPGQKNAFCRCGHSKNKPFCDGSHRNSGFEG